MSNKIICHLDVPYIGEMPAFNYRDVVTQPELALNNMAGCYLYILRKPKNSSNKDYTPFYVGIGHERRFAYHYLEASGVGSYIKHRRNKLKYNTIQKVGRDNVIIQMFNLETYDAAKNLEKELIKTWGRKNINLGSLTNLTDGGEGVLGLQMPEHVSKILREKAMTPVLFNGTPFKGIKEAFESHSSNNLASIFSTTFNISKEEALEKGYCNNYPNFKAIYSRWLSLGYCPEGFNYLNDDMTMGILPELSLEKIKKIKEKNIQSGFEKSWNTKYYYPKYRVPAGDYYTLSDAATAMNIPAANLVSKFRLMSERDHFSKGYNILDEQGSILFKERDNTLLELSRSNASVQLSEMSSTPMIVYGEEVQSIKIAYQLYEHTRGEYPNFIQQVSRWKKFGAFPTGLNIPKSHGGPYQEIEPSILLSSGPLKYYYMVCGQYYTSMQSASNYLGLPNNNSVAGLFERFKKNYSKGIPFPKGYNVYETKSGKALYNEQKKVCHKTPESGILYQGKYYKNYVEAAQITGKNKATVSNYFLRRRKMHLEKGTGFDSGMNVFGLDHKPLYPLNIGGDVSKQITTTTGKKIRHNAAKSILVKVNDDWVLFSPVKQAWHEVPWLRAAYKNSDSFSSTIRAQYKKGTLDPRIKYIEDK